VPFEELLYRETPALPRGSTLILISPSPVPKWAQVARHLKRSGVYVSAVVLDVKSFGGPPGTEDVVAELAASGIPISLIRNGDQLEEVSARQCMVQVAREYDPYHDPPPYRGYPLAQVMTPGAVAEWCRVWPKPMSHDQRSAHRSRRTAMAHPCGRC
jgi:hypothetical protein